MTFIEIYVNDKIVLFTFPSVFFPRYIIVYLNIVKRSILMLIIGSSSV